MACLQLSWVRLGCTGGYGGVDSEWGVLTGLDGIVGDMAGVWEVVSDETARFWVFWGKHGRWDRTWGCSEGSGRVCRCFRVVESGPEWGIAGDWAIVDSDVADCMDVWGIVVGSWRITGARGGMLEGAGWAPGPSFGVPREARPFRRAINVSRRTRLLIIVRLGLLGCRSSLWAVACLGSCLQGGSSRLGAGHRPGCHFSAICFRCRCRR
jgi:hypothetical protein